MVQRVAMHTIRRTVTPGKRASADGKTAAVKPVTQDIKPGTLWDVPPDELKDLEAAGAVVAPTDKRAAKFGFGSEAGKMAVEQEEGETDASAARRRRQATAAAAAAPVAPKNGRRTASLDKEDKKLIG
jgi:hypothetical protein